MLLKVILLAIITNSILAEDINIVGTARDSYTDAFKATHSLNKHEETSKVNRDSSYFPDQDSYPHPVFKPDYGPPQDTYGPPKDTYGPPKDSYGPPKDIYGPPKDNYGPPKDVYGPPQNSFGPPQNTYGAPVYGPPSYPQSPPAIYGPPAVESGYSLPNSLILGLLDKFKFKLDLFTIGKIILKLVIFKKIVSLIAILCLLLFIPSLKHKKEHHQNQQHDEYDEDEMRMFKERSANERINKLTHFVMESIEKFNDNYANENQTCKSVYCKSRKVVDYIDKKLSNERLMELYSQENM